MQEIANLMFALLLLFPLPLPLNSGSANNSADARMSYFVLEIKYNAPRKAKIVQFK